VLRAGEVDGEATAEARAAMAPRTDGVFDFGPGRARLERRWPPAVQDAVVRLLESVPVAVRDWGKHRIYERVQASAAGRLPTPADAEAAWREIRDQLSRALGEGPSASPPEGDGTPTRASGAAGAPSSVAP
jgi:N-methylhydantoinase B